MPLTAAQIKELLNKPQRTGSPKTGGLKADGKRIDVTIRDYQTWFQLAHFLFDHDTGERQKCDNPDCQDTRSREGTITVDINGTHMCRICFLAGWQSENPAQQILPLDQNPTG